MKEIEKPQPIEQNDAGQEQTTPSIDAVRAMLAINQKTHPQRTPRKPNPIQRQWNNQIYTKPNRDYIPGFRKRET